MSICSALTPTSFEMGIWTMGEKTQLKLGNPNELLTVDLERTAGAAGSQAVKVAANFKGW